MKVLRALALGGLLGWLLSLGCSSPALCQSSCKGCCDLNNECQEGTADTACGADALQCQRCAKGRCVDHACVASDGGTGGGTGGGATGGGAGGGSTGGGTGGGSTGGGSGGGSGGGTGGGTVFVEPDAGMINMTFGNCPAFNPCGGNPAGTWVYNSMCVPDTDFNPMEQTANMICGANATTISNKSGWAQGYAWFDGTGTDARRWVRGAMSFTATMSGVCSNSAACSLITGNLASLGFNGTCSVQNNLCVCNLNGGVNIDDASSYTVAGHTITLTQVGKTFDFCASATKITTRETTQGSNTKEPGYPSGGKQ